MMKNNSNSKFFSYVHNKKSLASKYLLARDSLIYLVGFKSIDAAALSTLRVSRRMQVPLQ